MAAALCDDKRIALVVDDEEMVEEVIGAFVEDYGCRHVSFHDPVKALQHYKENSRSIVLMVTGLTMPCLSGPELVRKVHEINPELPIILVTNYVGESIPSDIPPLVRDTVSKPFTRSEFFDVLKKAVVRAKH